MCKVYEQLHKDTAGITAIVVLREGAVVGKIVLKRTSTRIRAYVHEFGTTMRTATAPLHRWGDSAERALTKAAEGGCEDLYTALQDLDGSGVWENKLIEAGYRLVYAC